MANITPPNTKTTTSHGMVVRANAQTIGALNEWGVRINRTLTQVYEFGQVTRAGAGPGEPFETVPGNCSGMTIEARRFDLFKLTAERAFGTPDITMLSQQYDALTMREGWATPGAQDNFTRVYNGVWIQDKGRQLDAKGDRLVNVGLTFMYTWAQLIPGTATP
jgi:hypothetical protein